MDLTVVIPTRDRLPQLRATIEALAGQELGEVKAEVLVVDNGSSDSTCDWVHERADTFPYLLRLIEERSRGVSAARNRAVGEARGRLILSINDDTVPSDPTLLAGHVQAHIDAPTPVAVLGRITYPPDEMATDPFLAWLNDDAQFAYGRLERGEKPLPNHYYTAHLSFGREQFQAVGGMDERLTFGFEDAELGNRMMRGGIALQYRPDLILYHRHPITPAQWRARAERMGAAGALVNRLHRRTPPLAQSALSPYWRALELADRILTLVPTTWKWSPPSVRGRVYTILNQGSYTRGYRGAWRKVP